MAKSKILALALASVMLLSSCGIIIINDGKKEETSAVTKEEEITYIPPSYSIIPSEEYDKAARDKVNALPEANLQGMSAFIVVEKESGDFFNEESGSYAAINQYRTKLVEDKYNTNIIFAYDSSATIYNAVKSAKKTGDYYADFVVSAQTNFGKYKMDGYFGNLKSLPFIDLDEKYYNQNAMKLLSVGDVVYGAVGSLTENPRSLSCIYFNKTLGSELGIELDYSEIYNKKFTWDSYFEYVNAVPKDKAAAVVSSSNNDSIALFAFMASGSTFVTKSGSTYKASFINSRTDGIISTVKSVISKRTNSFKTTVTTLNGDKTETKNVTYSGFDIFKNGCSLTALGTLGNMTSLNNAGFSWEILPYPMYKEQDKYYSGTSVTSPVISFVASSTNIDTSGYILQGLFAASYDINKTKFVSDAMKDTITGIYTPDMLDIIMSNTVYDIGYLYMNDNSNLKNGTYNAYLKAVSGSSSLNSYAKKYTSKLNSYLATVK